MNAPVNVLNAIQLVNWQVLFENRWNGSRGSQVTRIQCRLDKELHRLKDIFVFEEWQLGKIAKNWAVTWEHTHHTGIYISGLWQLACSRSGVSRGDLPALPRPSAHNRSIFRFQTAVWLFTGIKAVKFSIRNSCYYKHNTYGIWGHSQQWPWGILTSAMSVRVSPTIRRNCLHLQGRRVTQ
jgi:hypothetical protein